MSKKRIMIASLLALILMFMVVACSSSEDSSEIGKVPVTEPIEVPQSVGEEMQQSQENVDVGEDMEVIETSVTEAISKINSENVTDEYVEQSQQLDHKKEVIADVVVEKNQGNMEDNKTSNQVVDKNEGEIVQNQLPNDSMSVQMNVGTVTPNNPENASDLKNTGELQKNFAPAGSDIEENKGSQNKLSNFPKAGEKVPTKLK